MKKASLLDRISESSQSPSRVGAMYAPEMFGEEQNVNVNVNVKVGAAMW
ncbi:hypothetical protein os4_25610 [Comamonadaceae bacterium OS-4]|nr:hypothetical protein os4_25610 [Comamonadaceae bacterium OS-4]